MRSALVAAMLVATMLGACMPAGDPTTSDMGSPGSGKFATDGGGDIVIPDGGKVPYLGACTTNDQCESGVCNAYPAKGGSFCTNPCTVATQAQDCPPPSPGCNHMGSCKVP
jgi:hypothetical protein